MSFSEGEACNHIVALLYAVADISEKNKEGKLAPTSQRCKWNNPRKRKLSPKKAEHVTFVKHSFDKKIDHEPSKKCVEVFNIQESTVDVVQFREKLLGINSKAGWLTNFVKDTTICEQKSLPLLHNIDFQFSDHVDLKDDKCSEFFESYFDKLNLSEENCDTIECMTRQQSKSVLWKTARHERITSSNFGRIVKRKSSTCAPESLLKDLCGYRTFTNQFVEYGRKHEPAARRTYICQMKRDLGHPGIIVQQSGLTVNPKYPHLGASPDGLVYCTCAKCKSVGHGLLEIKCPASMHWRMLTSHECAQDPNFYCYLDDNGDVLLKENHDYFYQVQGQMAITKRKWCDFVVWTCSGKASIQRIHYNEELWTGMAEKLKKFYVEAFLPELFCRRVQRGLKLHK